MSNDASVERQKLERAIITLGERLDDYFLPDGSTEFSSMALPIKELTQSNNILQLALSDFLHAIDGDK